MSNLYLHPQPMVTTRKDGEVKTRYVKNLGWLLRHWKDVQEFRLSEHRDIYGSVAATDRRVRMDVHLAGKDTATDVTYTAFWYDAEVCYGWLDRPVFRGLPVREEVNGKVTIYTIGQREVNDLSQAEVIR